MDTEKLLQILKEIGLDEQELNLSNQIESIRNAYAQNNDDGYRTAEEQLSNLVTQVKDKSRAYSFSRTEVLILEHLNGSKYWGAGLIDSLQNMTSGKNFEVVSKMDDYRKLRTDFIQKAKNIELSLVEIGLSGYKTNLYEVALILPESEGSTKSISKKIRDFEIIISSIQELTSNERREVIINRVSSGSPLEFFTLQPFDVAMAITGLLSNIVVVWDKISALQKKSEETNADNLFTVGTKEVIVRAINGQVSDIKNEITEKLPSELIKLAHKDIPEQRKNEIKNQLSIKINAMFHWFQLGVEIDVIPVRPEVSVTEIDSEETKQHSALLMEVKQINQSLQKIYELPLEQKKLPLKLVEDLSEDDR